MKPSLSLALVLTLAGCPTTPPTGDTGTPMVDAPSTLRCPRTNVPNADETMLPCCYRVSQAGSTAPELRLRFIDITQPAASPLAGDTVGDLLNTSLREEEFNWLFRVDGADGDGPITITTGFGRRNATTGTYAFSNGMPPDMMEWLPVTLAGNLTGEVVTTDVLNDLLTVPIYDETLTTVQIELQLEDIQVITSTFSENRSCVGTLRTALTHETGATLGGYITVARATAGTISFPGIETSLCGVLAGDLLSPTYCTDNAQADWMVPPDSLCDASGCQRNGMGATCTAATCNAWYLEADFAAVGVNIE